MNLNRINADIQTAELNISDTGNPTNDEFLYDVAAYHIQQAIEKELKYILHNVYGADETTKRFGTHNISTLLIQVNEYDSNFISSHQDIVENADEITSWEASTRYGEDLVATKDKIKEAIEYAKNLLEEIKNNN